MLNFPDMRVGTGFDVHRLIAGDGVQLGGIKIACNYKLKGHSDADVLLHAITDAVLGTCCAEDIGFHFSPNDERWKGADSIIFLQYALELLAQKKGHLHFIDTTIICEKPKISPSREAIRESVAKICNLPLDRVSVKATTTEQLGFTGRGEGIAVQASVTCFFES